MNAGRRKRDIHLAPSLQRFCDQFLGITSGGLQACPELRGGKALEVVKTQDLAFPRRHAFQNAAHKDLSFKTFDTHRIKRRDSVANRATFHHFVAHAFAPVTPACVAHCGDKPRARSLDTIPRPQHGKQRLLHQFLAVALRNVEFPGRDEEQKCPELHVEGTDVPRLPRRHLNRRVQ